MRALVDLDESLRRYVRVPLRGGERGVAEQLLDAAQVGAHVEKMRGEAVPQGVRMHVALRPADERILREVARDGARGEPPAAAIEQERRSTAELAAAREVGFQRRPRLLDERNDPFLAALAPHAHRGATVDEVREIEADQLGDAQPRVV